MNGIPEAKMSENALGVSRTIGIEKNENSSIPYGYCHCGCGKKTKIAIYSYDKNGCTKNKPRRFVLGHYAKVQPKNERAFRWKGGEIKNNTGRIIVRNTNHPRSSNGYVLRSILLAEKALGKPLPKSAQVHHFDGDPSNDIGNLVICENQIYHHLLHRRKKAYEASGHANWVRCVFCKKYDDPSKMHIFNDKRKRGTGYHAKCSREHYRKTRNEIPRHKRR